MVEMALPLSSTFTPSASSRIKFGCRTDAWVLGQVRGGENRIDRECNCEYQQSCDDEKISFCHSDFLTEHASRITYFVFRIMFLSSTPFNGIARITEGFPIHASIIAVTGIALQGIAGGLNHVCGCPVHVCFGEAILAAVG